MTCDCWAAPAAAEIGTARALRLVAEAACLRAGTLRFAGGEPLLRRDLFEILEASRGKFARVVLATNGLLLPRYADAINASCVTDVTVSIDGMAVANDTIRGVQGYFRRVTESLRHVRKRVKIAANLTRLLADDLAPLIALCTERRWGIAVNLLHDRSAFMCSPRVRANLDALWPTSEQSDRMIVTLLRHGVVPRHIAERYRTFLKTRHVDIRHCMQGYALVNVDPDGSIKPGCYLAKPVANIADVKLCEAVRSPEFANTARQMYDMRCPRCPCALVISGIYESPLASLGYVRTRLAAGKTNPVA